jgi:hypothetical protein
MAFDDRAPFAPLIAFALAMAVVAPASPAAAAPDAPAQDLKEQFAAAQKLFDDKAYADALVKFQELAASTGSPNAKLYVARTLQQLGRTVEAYDEFAATVREAAARVEAEPKYEQTRDAAAAELARLEPKVAHVVIAVTDPGAALTITLNGTSVTEASLGAPMTVLPGKQTIKITRPGSPEEVRELEVAGAQTKTLAIGAAGKAEATITTAPTKATDASGGGLGLVRTLGIVVGGVGVVGLVTGAVTGAMSDGKFSTLEDECGATRCTDPKYADDIDSGKSLELVANVTLIAGAVLAAASVPMIIFGGPSEEASATVQTERGGASVGFTYRF